MSKEMRGWAEGKGGKRGLSHSNHSLGPCMRHEKGAAALWRHFGLDLRSLAMMRVLLRLDLVADLAYRWTETSTLCKHCDC